LVGQSRLSSAAVASSDEGCEVIKGKVIVAKMPNIYFAITRNASSYIPSKPSCSLGQNSLYAQS